MSAVTKLRLLGENTKLGKYKFKILQGNSSLKNMKGVPGSENIVCSLALSSDLKVAMMWTSLYMYV